MVNLTLWRSLVCSDLRFVEEFLAYNIPVGALEIDSDWSSGINNFLWDAKKYPTPAAMVDKLHKLGVRVMLWVTTMINTDSSNYKDGCDKGADR
jgi:alpha-glucosidase (family GH31 glycosyl hydrolase)